MVSTVLRNSWGSTVKKEQGAQVEISGSQSPRGEGDSRGPMWLKSQSKDEAAPGSDTAHCFGVCLLCVLLRGRRLRVMVLLESPLLALLCSALT